MIESAREKLWTKAFLQISLVNLAMFVSFHMLNATFPFYIKELGSDEAIAGLATGLFSVASVVFRPFIGWMLDNQGRRTLLIVGLLGMLILPMSYAFINVLIIIIILRIIHGVLWSAASTSVTTVASDVIPQTRFGEGMGIFSSGSAASMAIGPLMGLFIMQKYGFTSMFFGATLCAVISVLLIWRAKYVSNSKTHQRFNFKEGFSSLIDKDALPASATMLLFVMPHGAVSTFIALYALEIGVINGGIFFTLMAVSTAIIRILSGRVADTRGEGPIVFVGNTSVILALFLLAFMPGNISFMLAAIVYGIGFGMMQPTMQAMAMRIAPEHRRGAASSTFLSSFDLGIGLGSLAAGYLIRYFDYFIMFGIMIICLFASLAVYIFWARKSPSSFYNRA